MSHIIEQIADYLENRLSPEQRREFEMHRDECDDCAAELAFVIRLRAEAMAQGMVHIGAERIVALAADRGAATPAESEHLAVCGDCRRDLEWAAAGADDETATEEEPDAERRRRAAPSFARRWWPAAAVAAAAVVAALIFLPRGSVNDRMPAGLARIEPLPVQITRAVVEPGTFEAARLRALELYRDGDYTGAHNTFGEALAMRQEDPEMLLYLGSCELLLGAAADATRHLETGLERTDHPALREELYWQLAQARIVTGDAQGARRALEAAAGISGRHTADARAQLEEIGK
jgi:tetratricopeptide (TPR) repeat protein